MGFISDHYLSSMVALPMVSPGMYELDDKGLVKGPLLDYGSLPTGTLVEAIKQKEKALGRFVLLHQRDVSVLERVDILPGDTLLTSVERTLDGLDPDLLSSSLFGDLTDSEVVLQESQKLGFRLPEEVSDSMLKLLTLRLYLMSQSFSSVLLSEADMEELSFVYPDLQLEPLVLVTLTVDQTNPDGLELKRSPVFAVRDDGFNITTLYRPVVIIEDDTPLVDEMDVPDFLETSGEGDSSESESVTVSGDDVALRLWDITCADLCKSGFFVTTLDGVTTGHCLLTEKDLDTLSKRSLARLEVLENMCRVAVFQQATLLTSFLLGKKIPELLLVDSILDEEYIVDTESFDALASSSSSSSSSTV